MEVEPTTEVDIKFEDNHLEAYIIDSHEHFVDKKEVIMEDNSEMSTPNNMHNLKTWDENGLLRTDRSAAKSLVCDFLEKYKTYYSLKMLMKIGDGKKTFACNICDKAYSCKVSLNLHMKVHSDNFVCSVCNKNFASKGCFDVHILLHSGEKPFKCNVCGKGFAIKCTLKQHLITHSKHKPFNCNICDKDFAGKTEFIRHLRVHTGEKPFMCNICKKCFSRKSHLEQHSVVHTGYKPFQCNLCNKMFSQKGGLTAHVQNVHNSSSCTRNTKCSNVRNKIFPTYSCSICEKKFKWKTNLNRHVLVHENAHNPCELCGKNFSCKSYVKEHITNVHNKEKLFICNNCDNRFSTKKTLIVHLKCCH